MKYSIIIANWKMQLGIKETEDLAEDILSRIGRLKKKVEKLDVVLCPSPSVLETVSKVFQTKHSLFSRKAKLSYLSLGAQNCFWEKKGAFTGEVSPAQLKELGCNYVIIGHSERRQILGETDKIIHKKVKAVLDTGMVPVICVGETFEERQRRATDYVIINQVSRAIEGIDLRADQKLIIAYEPVWVIGSGQAVKPEDAEYVNRIIRRRMIDFYPLPIVRNNIRIIYGGSIDSVNVKQFVSQETIDGALVGGASLKSKEFVKMISKLIG